MSRPRLQSRSPGSNRSRKSSQSSQPIGPRKSGQPSAGWRAAVTDRLTIPTPGRLAGLGALVAVMVATLVLLVTVSAGGLNRFGLQRLAADAPASAPTQTRYINR